MTTTRKPMFKAGDKVEHVFSGLIGTVTSATRLRVKVLVDGRSQEWRSGSVIKVEEAK